jgi:plasmid stabilization system protein ParE
MHLSMAFDFVAAHNLSAAQRQDEIIVRAVTRLADFPQLGRVGRIAGTRELVIPGTPYIAAYIVLDGAIAVLAILHGAQRWPVRP